MRVRLSKLLLVPAFAAAAALTGGVAHAAETITLPFDFTAMGRSFPSGSYTVEQNPGTHLVTLHQVKGTATLNWAVGAGAESEHGHVLLNFGQAADGTHVLRSIQFGRRFNLTGSPFQNTPGRPAAARN